MLKAKHIVFLFFIVQSFPAAALSAEGGKSLLQERIANARQGDTLQVGPGVYEGNLLIDKRLVLLGEGMPVIRGDGTASCINVKADSCVIRGFIVEHSGGNLMHEDAGILLQSKHNIVEGNELRDVLFGIYLFRADCNVVANNSIRGRKELEEGQRGSGIHLYDSNSNHLFGNTITDARDGFYFQYARHTLVERNKVFGLRYGLHYMYADSNQFFYNTFYQNVAGAAVMYSSQITLRHNLFIHNRGFASYGILFQDCHQVKADSNIVADNVVGFFFESTTQSLFRHNVIAQNDLALQMFSNSVGNTFTENNFIDNINNLMIVGKRTDSKWSLNGRGNYWSGYEGYDLDLDGVGDIPMKIQNAFSYLEGRYPNVRLYLYSPAAQALAVAARAFPILEVTQEVDLHPLMRSVNLADMPAMSLEGRLDQETEHPAAHQSTIWIGLPLFVLISVVVAYRLLSKRIES